MGRWKASTDDESRIRRLQESVEELHAVLAVTGAADKVSRRFVISRGERSFSKVLLDPYIKILFWKAGQGETLHPYQLVKAATDMPLAALASDVAHVRRSGCGSRNA